MSRAVTKRLSKSLSHRDVIMFLIGGVIILGGSMAIAKITSLSVPLEVAVKPAAVTSPWIPETVRQWDDIITEMSSKYNVDPNLIAIIITMESGGNAQAKSEAGAEGLMQVMPLTAKDISTKFLKEPAKSYDILDPRTNIEFGTAYLAYLRDEFGTARQGPSWNETVELIAAGYNGGPGAANNLEQGKGLEDTQTVVYSRDAFNMWRERNSQKSPTFERWKERGGSSLISKAQ